MKNKISESLVIAIMAIIPITFLLYSWDIIPETIPIHYNLSGKPDGWAGKNSLIAFALLPTIIYGVLLIIPKVIGKSWGVTYVWIRLISVIIISCTVLIMFYLIVYPSTEGINYNFLLIGVVIIIMGQFMKSIEPNSLFGVRTPWTLSNREVWRDTHIFSSKILLGAGLLIIVFSLFLPSKVLSISVVSIVVGTAIITIIYSYFSNKKIEPRM